MSRPASLDLRKRIVEAYSQREGSFSELADRFKVGRASVERYVRQYRESGSLDPKPMGGARRPPKVDAEGEAFLKETLEALPDSSLPELSAAYEEVLGEKVSPQTLSDTLRRLGYTKKKPSSGPRPPSAPTWSPPATPGKKSKPR